ICRRGEGTHKRAKSFLTKHIYCAALTVAVLQMSQRETLMTVTDIAAARLSPSAHAMQLRRAGVASTIGTAIEWYHFFVFTTVPGLVFAQLFFPKSDPWIGTLEAFAVYAVGFVARPVGAAIFGHYGDRIGRKSTLIATLLLMGLATFAVALVP